MHLFLKKHHHFLFFKDQCLIISLHRIQNLNNYEPQRHDEFTMLLHAVYNFCNFMNKTGLTIFIEKQNKVTRTRPVEF